MKYNQLTEFEEFNTERVSPVEVTVLCYTYNHKEYITSALEGFVKQQTSFDYEILIYDDASTDGTSEIIRHYSRTYPDKIKAFIAKENTYANPEHYEARKEWEKEFINGKYVALCEGDDYWISSDKLQKQWNALETHSECDMCACRANVVCDNGIDEVNEIRPQKGNGILSAENVILGGGQYLATAGLFFRRSMSQENMKFEKILSMDYVRQIKGSLRGGIYYFDEIMVAYRRFANGSWTASMMANRNRLHEQWQKEKMMLASLDEETGGKYHSAISERMKAYLTFEEQLGDRKKELMSMIASLTGTVYLWGMGRRGVDFEDFCIKENIRLTGVCDKAFQEDKIITERGSVIASTEHVLQNADNILASNSIIYDYLKDKYRGNLINLQDYMPYG